MTLGEIQTPIADGIFDPATDRVTLKNGTVITNYYRDVRGVKFYQSLDKSHFQTPPSGWCTWYYYYNRITAEEVERNADWIAANLKDYGAAVVQIDDGWQGTGAQGGARNWEAVNTNHFPDGMAAVARHIKSLGLTPGLWIAPHGQNNDEVVHENPGVFLLKPDGSTASDTWEGRFLVDPSNPQSLKYLDHLFRRLCDWGYDYLKIDGQPIVVDEYGKTKAFMINPSDDVSGLYRDTLKTIRNAIGPDRYLLSCWGIPMEGVGLMDGSRTGGDVVLGWGGFQVALWPTLQYYYLHQIVWYCDPDVLLVRSPLTLDQARVWTTIEGLTGQALMSSDRLMDLSEDRVELLRRVFPATDIHPLDLFPSDHYKRIWDLKVNHLNRRYDVVGVFNFAADRADQVFLSWNDLGLPVGRPVHIFDFWNQEYLGEWTGGYAVPTAPTSCRALTLLPDNGKIQLISTSRHITQGPVDLISLEPGGNTFKGRSHVIKNDPYQLSFVFPHGTNYVVTRTIAAAGKHKLLVKIFNHQGWASVKIVSPETQDVTWEVEFGPGEYYHFPPGTPARLSASSAGLTGATLKWEEQYYLNAGYQVYLNGKLLGGTPEARFDIHGLNCQSNYTAEVKSVWEDGAESAQSASVEFSPATIAPERLYLSGLEPEKSNGNWNGFEIDGLLDATTCMVSGKHFGHSLSAFAGSEIEFDLHGLYEKFTAKVGLDDSSDENTVGEFVVIGDGRELWRSGLVKKGDSPKLLEMPIPGVHRLVLRSSKVEQAKGRVLNSWLEPSVLKLQQ